MTPDNASALAEEVRQLKALLVELQAELTPAMQSSLRERSSELQRLGGELAERQDKLDKAQARAADLERDVERWRGTATRGVDEIAERARATAERFEQQSAELNQTLAVVRAKLEASRVQTDAASQARDGALKDLERSRRRLGSLKAKLLRREARRVQMTRSFSWRITAPLRWLAQGMKRLLLGGARLRRRMFRR